MINRVGVEGPPIKAAASWRREKAADILYKAFGRSRGEEPKEGERGRCRTIARWTLQPWPSSQSERSKSSACRLSAPLNLSLLSKKEYPRGTITWASNNLCCSVRLSAIGSPARFAPCQESNRQRQTGDADRLGTEKGTTSLSQPLFRCGFPDTKVSGNQFSHASVAC